MNGATLTGPGRVELLPMGKVEGEEDLLNVLVCGVCHSDRKAFSKSLPVGCCFLRTRASLSYAEDDSQRNLDVLHAYNCVRRLMYEAAREADIEVRVVSFKGSVQASVAGSHI